MERRGAAFWFIIFCWSYRVYDHLKLRGVLPMSDAERQQIEREARWNAWHAERDPKDLAEAWASVQPDMEKPAIRALLGEPHQIRTTRDASCWTYERDGARGRIEFGFEGRVTRVHPPSSVPCQTTP